MNGDTVIATLIVATLFTACFGIYINREQCPEVHTRMKERISLPEKCHPFYNDGTGRWAECIGVEPK